MPCSAASGENGGGRLHCIDWTWQPQQAVCPEARSSAAAKLLRVSAGCGAVSRATGCIGCGRILGNQGHARAHPRSPGAVHRGQVPQNPPAWVCIHQRPAAVPSLPKLWSASTAAHRWTRRLVTRQSASSPCSRHSAQARTAQSTEHGMIIFTVAHLLAAAVHHRGGEGALVLESAGFKGRLAVVLQEVDGTCTSTPSTLMPCLRKKFTLLGWHLQLSSEAHSTIWYRGCVLSPRHRCCAQHQL